MTIKIKKEDLKETKNQRSNKPRVYVALVVDKSGSMGSIRDEAISAVNEQIQTVKNRADEVDTLVSLVTFDSSVNIQYYNQPLSEVKDLTEKTYYPDGGTAMRDGVGTIVTRLSDDLKDVDEKEDYSVLVAIVSDGYENSSKEFSASEISEMVKSKQDTKKWTFVYLCANQDLTKIKDQFGFKTGNIMSFAATSRGVKNLSGEFSSGINSYYRSRVAGETEMENFAEAAKESTDE